MLTKYAEQIQSYIKRSITAKVEASEEELIQVITKVFKEFSLILIENAMDNSEGVNMGSTTLGELQIDSILVMEVFLNARDNKIV